jgi:hypothetical protein
MAGRRRARGRPDRDIQPPLYTTSPYITRATHHFGWTDETDGSMTYVEVG